METWGQSYERYLSPTEARECPNPACEDGQVPVAYRDGEPIYVPCPNDAHRDPSEVEAEARVAAAEFADDLRNDR